MASSPTLGSFLFDYLYKKGAKVAFGIPGDFVLPTFRWLDQSKMDLITMAHEPAVGFAADGYARIHGLGVAVITYCVGGLNLVNSIAGAYAEKSPVLVISGAPSMKDRRGDKLIHHKVKTFDTQRNVFQEVTCASALINDPKTAASEIIRVVETVLAMSRPGYLEIPYDMVDLPIAPYRKQPSVATEIDQEVLDACLDEIGARINAAKRPVMIADIELHRHKLTDLAMDIATHYQIPVASTLLSKSIIRETNPLYLGVYSGGLSEPACQEYVESSDCLIMLGAFISDVFLGQYSADIDRKCTILATTEHTRVGLHHYEGVTLIDVLKGLKQRKLKSHKKFVRPYALHEPMPFQAKEAHKPLSAEDIFRLLSFEVDEGTTIVCDTGDSLLGSSRIRMMKRQTFLSNAYYLSMGFSIPAGIGAMAGKKNEKAYVIVGDGAFQMTGMELSTAVKYRMAPVVIVLNNDGYGTQRHIIDGSFNNIQMWNYADIGKFIGGGTGKKVRTCGEFVRALKEASKAKVVYVIECIIPRDDCSAPLRRMGELLGSQRDSKKPKSMPKKKKHLGSRKKKA